MDAEYGFSIPYPPDWTMTSVPITQASTELSLVPSSLPLTFVSVQVVNLQVLATLADISAPPFQSIPGYGLLQQGKRFGSQLQTQKLTGEASSSQNGSEQIKSALFKQHGNGYLIRLRYPVEGAADQDLLTTFDAMVEGFRLSQ